MKKNMTKTVATILAGAMILSGCGSSNGETAKADASATVAKEEQSEKTQIEYWHVNAETQGGLSVEELVQKFNAQSDTVEVTARYNPDMYKGLMQNLQADLATGKSPAIVQIGWAFLDYFSNNFAYTEPQSVIDTYDAEDKTFLSDNFLPNVLALAENSEGSQVGLPYSLSTPVLYINRDMLKEAGLPEEGPETWEDVIAFSDAIKEETGNYGLYIQEPSDFWAQQAIIESNDSQMITTEGDKIQATFASEKGIEAFGAYAQMVQDGTALHISWDEGVQSFIDGKVCMLYTTIARRAQIQEAIQFDGGTVMSPVWEGEDRAIPAGGCFLAITAQTDEELAAAWEFEKFLYSIESVATWTIGTGYVPPRTGVDTAEEGLKGFLEENEMMKAAFAQMDGLVPWTSFPGDAGLQAEQLLLDMRDQVLGGQISAEEGLTTTQNKINELLDAQQ